MARPKAEGMTHLHIQIKISKKAQLDQILFDKEKGVVPYGSHRRWVEARIEEWLTSSQLELEKYGFKPGEMIYGPEKTIMKIKKIFDDAMND